MSEHLTLRMDAQLLERVDRLVDEDEFANRSEALREGARRLCLSSELQERAGEEVAAVEGCR